MAIKVNDIQVSLFVRNASNVRGLSQIALDLKDDCQFLNSEPTVLPTENAPEDIPRIIVDSRDGAYQVIISKNKIGLVSRNIPNNSKSMETLASDLLEKAELLRKFVVRQKWEVNRIGVIVNVEKNLNDGLLAADYIHDTFIKVVRGREDKFFKPWEMSITYVKREIFSGVDTNFLIFLSQKGSGRNRQPEVLVGMFDINTKPELMSEYTFVDDEIRTFISDSISKIKDLPAQYLGG